MERAGKSPAERAMERETAAWELGFRSGENSSDAHWRFMLTDHGPVPDAVAALGAGAVADWLSEQLPDLP